MSDTIEFARELIRRASVTAEDEGCQKLMIERLRNAGFDIEDMAFTEEGYDLGPLPYQTVLSKFNEMQEEE